MNRTLFSLITLSLFACEEASQEDGISPIDFDNQSSDDSWNQSEANQGEPESNESGTESKADLVCSTGGFFDNDGQIRVLRMELKQDGDKILVVANKGVVHPTAEDPSFTSFFEVEGTIGSEFLHLSIDSEHQTSDEEDPFVGQLALQLNRVQMGDQLLYKGDLGQFGCGSYGNSNSVTCWQPDIEPEFTYDSLNGVCLNERNEQGFNPWTLEMIRETGDGQCSFLYFSELNEGDYNHPDLSWDLRGSDLGYSMLYFANLRDAQLEGTQMENLSFGYAEIEGSIDDFTLFPEACVEGGEELYCKQ